MEINKWRLGALNTKGGEKLNMEGRDADEKEQELWREMWTESMCENECADGSFLCVCMLLSVTQTDTRGQ